MKNRENEPSTGAEYAGHGAQRSAEVIDIGQPVPQDDHIGKHESLQGCFPTAGRLKSQEILQLIEAGNGGVFILYEYELKTGERYRNTEFITVWDGQLAETQVFSAAGSDSSRRLARDFVIAMPGRAAGEVNSA